MKEVRVELETRKSVQECAIAFREGVNGAYGGARKLIRGLGALRGADTGGLEFFTPNDGPFEGIGQRFDFKAGAWVPGHSKWSGATRMAVHVYVIDHGKHREVQIVGPYGTGDRGSTERLVQAIANQYR